MESTHHKTTDLVIGLDFQTVDRALDFVEKVHEPEVSYQVGIELFLNGGPELLRELAHRKQRVLLDLKLLDTPSQVAKAVQQAALYHVDALSLQLMGGGAMFRAVRLALEEISSLRPRLLGVGALGSFDDVRWAEVTRALTGHAVRVADSFGSLLDCAFAWGLDGVFCRATELERVRNTYPNLYTLVSMDFSQCDSFLELVRSLRADAVLLSASSLLRGHPMSELAGVFRGYGFSLS